MKNKIKWILALCLLITFSPLSLWAEEENTEVEVEKTEVLKVPPRGQKGRVTIKTVPAKAIVYLDGDELGMSPIEDLEFRSGRFDLTIMLRGEELYNKRVNVWPGKTLLVDETLTMPYGTVIITTKPSKAQVYMDGSFIMKTEGGPLTINNIEAGNHTIRAKIGRRKSRSQEVTINGEDTVHVNLTIR